MAVVICRLVAALRFQAFQSACEAADVRADSVDRCRGLECCYLVSQLCLFRQRRSWKGARPLQMGNGSFLRNNCLTTLSEAPPRSRCIRRRNCDGLSSLSSSFVSACRMRWPFVCALRFRHHSRVTNFRG
ncbi:hypothetical protein T07_10255 [Trichinella nelsoni]|uniref:Secreted protein n=1 Tax=Trichinella nelsoni TaxID=6336 RepID=A0A0V0SMR5_9BILA|nr:hypothetical protein T07_10255 [Trichinella nelsoni]